MRRVTGIGDIFFNAEDPEKLYAWYEKHLGIARVDGNVMFTSDSGFTVWSIFPKKSEYFAPSVSSLMINYRVDDLTALLDTLRAEGVEIDPKREDCDYGRFAWILDPEGNEVELWEPPKASL